MPSAGQVSTDGIELVEMQALHLIQLEKANEALNARVGKLEN